MITNKKLKATRFFKPYDQDGSYNLKNTGTGVYIIKKNDVILYVGLSLTDVRSTLYRHFQKWIDKRTNWTKKSQMYERVTYYGENRNMFLVKVIFTPTKNEAAILENLLILKLKPRDNTLKLELYSNKEMQAMTWKFNESEAWKPANITDVNF